MRNVTMRAHNNAAATPAEREAGGFLTIDLAAIVANWRALATRASPAECAAVVKADAYGCGAERVADALHVAGCDTFFVAHLAEGRLVRAIAPGAAIYVLNGLLPGTADAFAAANLRPVLGAPEDLAEWMAFRSASGWLGGAALHVDTGMHRLGLTPNETAPLAARNDIPHAITLLMSHFACSDEPAHPLNARQLACFTEVRRQFPSIPASLANSSGLFLGPDAHHDLVRPGIALYGGNPTPGHANLMQPVVRLEGRIVQVREVPAGETVGYGAAWTAHRASRIAIVSIGYADGLLRAAGTADGHGGAEAMVAGHRCPLAGRVSMDLLAIDITGCTKPVRRGDMATLLGDEITVDDLATHAGTIAYEILTSLGRRYHRVYRGG